jgi:hypothetical protein
MTKSKTTKIKAELYPLSKKEFQDLYDKAWDYGWVYGKFFQELYDEYLVNWVYFVDYLDVLKGVELDDRMYKRIQDNFVIVTANNQKPIIIEAKDFYFENFTNKKVKEGEINSDVEILIGEAPPYWKGDAENKDKSYFYNPNYFVKKGSWITAPLAFKGIKDLRSSPENKTSKLTELAKKRMFLFDVFPFPIIQDTKIRQAVSGKFPEHIQTYFIPKLNSIINYIGVEKENIKYGFAATTYGSLHLLFGDQTRGILKKFDVNFYAKGIEVCVLNINLIHKGEKNDKQIVAFNEKNIPTVLFKYIYKLICPEEIFDASFKEINSKDSFNKDKYVDEINKILGENKIPILMDGSGNVNFTKFFNSTNSSSLLDEDNNFEKNQQEED